MHEKPDTISFTEEFPTTAGLALTALVLLLALATTGPLALAASADSDEVVAKVNGEKITTEEFAERAKVFNVLNQARGIPEYYEFLLSTDTGRSFLSEYQKFILERMIEETLQVQRAKKRGIKATDSEVKEAINNIIESSEGIKNENQLEDKLKKNDRSLTELKKKIRNDILRSKLKQEVVGEVSISYDEVKKFYQNNKSYFMDQEGEVRKFEAVKGKVAGVVRDMKVSQAWSDWMESAKKEADIVRNL